MKLFNWGKRSASSLSGKLGWKLEHSAANTYKAGLIFHQIWVGLEGLSLCWPRQWQTGYTEELASWCTAPWERWNKTIYMIDSIKVSCDLGKPVCKIPLQRVKLIKNFFGFGCKKLPWNIAGFFHVSFCHIKLWLLTCHIQVDHSFHNFRRRLQQLLVCYCLDVVISRH